MTNTNVIELAPKNDAINRAPLHRDRRDSDSTPGDTGTR